MSVNLETPAFAEQPNLPTEVAEHSRLRAALDAAGRFAGRTTLAVSLALGPGVALGIGESLLEATPAHAATIGEDDYPNKDAYCVAPGDPDDGTTSGSGEWCDDYDWGYWIKNSSGQIIGNNQQSSRGYAFRNCTDWAAFRVKDLTGVEIPHGLGNAANWDNAAPSGWAITGTPEAGDLANSETTAPYGHVGVVEKVNKDSSSKITSIEVSEYNKGQNGVYSYNTYAPDANGVYWRDAAHSKKWDHFIDVNGVGTDINGDASGNTLAPDADGDGVADVDDSCPSKPGLSSNHGCPVQHVFSGMNDGRVLETYWGASNSLTTWQAADVSEPVTAVTDQIANDTEHVFFGTQGGELWEAYWGKNNSLTQWEIADLNSPINSISSQTTPDGTQHVYAGTDNGVLSESYWGPSNALTTYSMASQSSPVKSLSSQLTQNSLGTVQHVFWGTADGKLRETYVGGGNGLTSAVMANEAAPIAGIDSAIDGSGNSHIFSSTTDGKSYDTYWGPKASLTNAQMANLGRTITSMTARYVKGTWHIYNGGADGNIWDTYWGGTNALTTAPLYNMGYAITKLSAEAETDGTQHIYTATENGKEQETYLGGGNSLTNWQIANLGSGINAIASDIK